MCTRLAPLTVIDDPYYSARRPVWLFSHGACARRLLRTQQSFFFCQTFPALICFEARLKTRIQISQTAVEDKAAAFQHEGRMQSNSLRSLSPRQTLSIVRTDALFNHHAATVAKQITAHINSRALIISRIRLKVRYDFQDGNMTAFSRSTWF